MANLLSGQIITPARSRGYQSGTQSVSFSAVANQTATITFPTAFGATPRIVCQVVSSAGAAVKSTVLVTSVSASSAAIRVDLAASATVTLSVHWIAVEP